MTTFALQFLNDETGFVLSGELVVISTILTIGMVVGLADVSHAVHRQLNDVSSHFDDVNQASRYSGLFNGGEHGHRINDREYSDHDTNCRGW